MQQKEVSGYTLHATQQPEAGVPLRYKKSNRSLIDKEKNKKIASIRNSELYRAY